MRITIVRSWVVLALMLVACDTPDSVSVDSESRALIIVDMQYDFMPGGALPTAEGDQIIELINQLQHKFDLVVATQDWHPQHHGSFASNHSGQQAGESINLNGLEQILWPDHSVQGTHGAELVDELDQSKIARVFQKGINPEVDSYSGFFDNGQRGDTGLEAYLRANDIADVYVVGLALDYCVKYTALDAQRIGFNTTLIVDASRAVNLHPTDGDDAVEAVKKVGVEVVMADSLLQP